MDFYKNDFQHVRLFYVDRDTEIHLPTVKNVEIAIESSVARVDIHTNEDFVYDTIRIIGSAKVVNLCSMLKAKLMIVEPFADITHEELKQKLASLDNLRCEKIIVVSLANVEDVKQLANTIQVV